MLQNTGLFSVAVCTNEGQLSELSASGLTVGEAKRAIRDMQMLARRFPALARTAAGTMSTIYRAKRANAEAAARLASR